MELAFSYSQFVDVKNIQILQKERQINRNLLGEINFLNFLRLILNKSCLELI